MIVHYNPLGNTKGVYTYELDSDKDGYLTDLFNDVLYPEDLSFINTSFVYVKLKGEVCISSDLCVIESFISNMQGYETGCDENWCIISEFETQYAAYEFAINIIKANQDTNYSFN